MCICGVKEPSFEPQDLIADYNRELEQPRGEYRGQIEISDHKRDRELTILPGCGIGRSQDLQNAILTAMQNMHKTDRETAKLHLECRGKKMMQWETLNMEIAEAEREYITGKRNYNAY